MLSNPRRIGLGFGSQTEGRRSLEAQLVGEGDDSDEEDEVDEIVELELGEDLDGMEMVSQMESGEETLWALPVQFA